MNESFIPENPPIHLKGIEQVRAENHFSSVRDRATVAPLVIPALPVLVEVEPEKIERRSFGQAPMGF
jgi:hypothetical protein